jgi:hypothetical protein
MKTTVKTHRIRIDGRKTGYSMWLQHLGHTGSLTMTATPSKARKLSEQKAHLVLAEVQQILRHETLTIERVSA